MTLTPPAKPRLTYLDTTKGILVLLMVVYHSLNYTNQYQLAFKYLSFLPLSFIFITGFLLTLVYSARYKNGDRRLSVRLWQRGGRLLLLFTALNVLAQFVRSPAYGQSVGVLAFFQNGAAVYLIGGSRIAAFEVLLPIAYLLLLAPALIALDHRQPAILPVTAIALVGVCAGLDRAGISLFNFNFLSAGIFGMFAGRLLPEPVKLGRFVWLALFAYAVYFPLGVARGWVFLVQLLGAVVALTFICAVSVRVGDGGWWRERIIRIGQYSLLSYIVQIGILQVLSRFFGRPDPFSTEALILFATTIILMTTAVELTQWCRNQHSRIDQAYKAVFA